MKRLHYKLPFKLIHKFQPDLSDLRVFGCGAYVHLPEAKRKNKLQPCAELMLYLGKPPGQKGYLFMCQNGSLFMGTTTIFDESRFPRCDQKKINHYLIHRVMRIMMMMTWNRIHLMRINLQIFQTPVMIHDHHKGPPFPLDPKRDPDNTPPKDADAPLDQDFLHPTQSDFEPHREDQEEWQQLPRRSGQTRTIPTCSGNVYGEKWLPSDIVRDTACDRYWKKQVGDEGSSHKPTVKIPGPASVPHSTNDTPMDVDENLEPSTQSPPKQRDNDDEEARIVAKLAQEGGESLFIYLLNQVIPPDSEVPIQYHDIQRMHRSAKEDWMKACRKKLELLCRH